MLRGGVCGAGIKFSPFGTLATILAAFAVGAGTSQAIFGAASGHEFGDFFGSYFESFEDAFVHLGMSVGLCDRSFRDADEKDRTKKGQ